MTDRADEVGDYQSPSRTYGSLQIDTCNTTDLNQAWYMASTASAE